MIAAQLGDDLVEQRVVLLDAARALAVRHEAAPRQRVARQVAQLLAHVTALEAALDVLHHQLADLLPGAQDVGRHLRDGRARDHVRHDGELRAPARQQGSAVRKKPDWGLGGSGGVGWRSGIAHPEATHLAGVVLDGGGHLLRAAHRRRPPAAVVRLVLLPGPA